MVPVPDIPCLGSGGQIGVAGYRVEGMVEVCGSHQAGVFPQFFESMEHHHPPAEAVGADLETGTVAREGVRTAIPGSLLTIDVGIINVIVTLAIIKDHFEEEITLIGCLIPVLDPFQILIGETHVIGQPVLLGKAGGIYLLGILFFVFIGDNVSFIITALFNKPLEYA